MWAFLLAADVVVGGGGSEVSQGRMEPGATGHHPNGKGGILYCVVARGATVLARCSKSVTRFKKKLQSIRKLNFSQACFMRWKFCRNQWLGPGKGRFCTQSNQLKLDKVREQDQPRMTLTQGEFLFHYVNSDGVVALAIAGIRSFLSALSRVLYISMNYHNITVSKWAP